MIDHCGCDCTRITDMPSSYGWMPVSSSSGIAVADPASASGSAVAGSAVASFFAAGPAARFHNVAPGQPHVHAHFHAAPHEGCRVIAVCGKGGVGKTAFCAMLAKACVESGECGHILAVDADPAFGLALALGIEVEHTIGDVREEVIRTARGGEAAAEAELAGKLDYLIARTLVETPELSLIAMGRSDALGCYCSVNDFLRDSLQLLVREYDTVIIDGEAGLEQVNRQVMSGIDDLVILSDGSLRGMNTVDLLFKIAEGEKIVDHDHIGVVLDRPPLDPTVLEERISSLKDHYLGSVPADPQVAAFDAAGKPLFGLTLDSPAYHAVWHIAEKLLS